MYQVYISSHHTLQDIKMYACFKKCSKPPSVHNTLQEHFKTLIHMGTEEDLLHDSDNKRLVQVITCIIQLKIKVVINMFHMQC